VASPLPVGNGRARTRDQAIIEEEVRRLVARELHDRVAQTLTGMLVDVENFKTEEVGWVDVVRQLDKVQTSTRQVLHSLRQLLHDLRGEETVSDDFVDAVRGLIGRYSERTGITLELSVLPGWPETFTRPAYVNLYRIIEEALTNVRMHSGARHVRVVLEPRSRSEVSVMIRDDGRGLDTDASRPAGLGTVGMRERAVLMGGRLTIQSEPGAGTTVHAIFPESQLVPKDVSPSTEILTPSEVTA
jgi:signal transduction histidine kinase